VAFQLKTFCLGWLSKGIFRNSLLFFKSTGNYFQPKIVISACDNLAMCTEISNDLKIQARRRRNKHFVSDDQSRKFGSENAELV
jgi:hypothetical protein